MPLQFESFPNASDPPKDSKLNTLSYETELYVFLELHTLRFSTQISLMKEWP